MGLTVSTISSGIKLVPITVAVASAMSTSFMTTDHESSNKPRCTSFNAKRVPSSARSIVSKLSQVPIPCDSATPSTDKAIWFDEFASAWMDTSPSALNVDVNKPSAASVQKRISPFPDTGRSKNAAITAISVAVICPSMFPLNPRRSKGSPTPDPAALMVRSPLPRALSCNSRRLPSRFKSRSTSRRSSSSSSP